MNYQILEAIKQMPNMEKIEIIDFTLKLICEEMQQPEKLD